MENFPSKPDEASSKESEPVHITDALSTDTEDFVRIQRECWVKNYTNAAAGITEEDVLTRDWKDPKRLLRIRREIEGEEKGTTHYWALRGTDGKTVGFCGAEQKEAYGEILRIFILPEYQGRGLGEKLMKTAMDWIGGKDIKLEVVAYNERAIGLYKKLGFQKTAEEASGTELPNGKRISRIMMVRPRV